MNLMKVFGFIIIFISSFFVYPFIIAFLKSISLFSDVYESVNNFTDNNYKEKFLTSTDLDHLGSLSLINIILFIFFLALTAIIITRFQRKFIIEGLIVILLFLFPTFPKLQYSGTYTTMEPDSPSIDNYNPVKPLGIGVIYFITKPDETSRWLTSPYGISLFLNIPVNKYIGVELFEKQYHYTPTRELIIEFFSIIIGIISMYLIRNFFMNKVDKKGPEIKTEPIINNTI